MRAFARRKIIGLSLMTTGMEWAAEMAIRSGLDGLRMTEGPMTLHRDRRCCSPHLRRWRDGWRHLCLMLFHVPCRFSRVKTPV